MLYITGYYCPEGTAQPEACPPGTFGSRDGLANVSQCTDCLPGKYCQASALTDVEGINL